MSWWGFGWGYPLGYRKPVSVRKSGRKAPKNCPRCGRRMVTHIVYYQCPGCGYQEHLPGAKPHRDIQPVDSLQERLEEQIEEAERSGDVRASDFALAVVPPEMAREFRLLVGLGWLLLATLVIAWGAQIWMDSAYVIDADFKTCWGLVLAAGIYLAVALIHTARTLKQIGIVVAIVLIPLCIVAHLLITPEMRAKALVGSYEPLMAVIVWLQLNLFLAGAVYCAWLAWYLIRERRLQGW